MKSKIIILALAISVLTILKESSLLLESFNYEFPEVNMQKEYVIIDPTNVLTKEQKDVANQIAEISNGYKTDYLIKLAWCESMLNPNAININTNKTRDLGLFQINDVHHLTDEERYAILESTQWTIEKIKSGGQGIWVCNDIILSEK